MKTGIPTNGSMVKNHISSKKGIRRPCNTENFFPIEVPRLSRSSSGSSSTTKTPSRQESHSSSSSSNSFQAREREDRIEIDISPVHVSNLVDDGSGPPEEIPSQQNPKTK